MAFTRDWNEATPLGTADANTLDTIIKNGEVDISDRLKNMVYGFIAGENSVAQHFQYVQFYEQASVSQPSAGFGRVYTKAVGGKCELFWQDEDGDEIQLTSGGKFMIGYGTGSQALMHNTTEEDTNGGRESSIRAKGEQSGGEVTTLGYIEFYHEGTEDDEKGKIKIALNDGDDGDAPSKVPIIYASTGKIDVANSLSVLDEDDMASDDAAVLATQQSIKKYVDDVDSSRDFTPTAAEGDADEAAGEVTLPNGLELKWGKTAYSENDTAIDFTDEGLTDFSNFCFNVQVTCAGEVSNFGTACSVDGISKTGFTVYSNVSNLENVYWFAIGR